MTRSLLEHPSAPDFSREFHEEHLSELTFLLAQRRRHLHDSEVEWPDIESLEVRILRHAEAMREELAHPRSPFDTRARAALEMDIRSEQTFGFQPDWPVRRQHQTLVQWRRWWAEHARPL